MERRVLIRFCAFTKGRRGSTAHRYGLGGKKKEEISTTGLIDDAAKRSNLPSENWIGEARSPCKVELGGRVDADVTAYIQARILRHDIMKARSWRCATHHFDALGWSSTEDINRRAPSTDLELAARRCSSAVARSSGLTTSPVMMMKNENNNITRCQQRTGR